MRTWRKAVSSFLVLVMLLTLIPLPAARAAETATASGGGITITQKAAWNKTVPGNTVVDVTVDVTSQMDLQTPKDVVFVIDCAASQDLYQWRQEANALKTLLSGVSGMRYALVSYETTASKLLDFTSSVNDLTRAISNTRIGVNSNAYAGLKLAQELIQNRDDTTNKACVVLLSTAKFNMNLAKTTALGRTLKASVPVYGINGTKYHPDLMFAVCTSQLNVEEMAIAIGESRKCNDAAVTVQLGDAFSLASTDGEETTCTFSIPNFQMGHSYSFRLSGKLRDRTASGLLTASRAASISGTGLAQISTGAVDVTRSSLSVTYEPNGGTGSVPVDSSRYNSGDTVTVKPASLHKEGWNFSGWTHPTLNLERGSFPITQNTTLNASWGRAFVKLSTSTVSSNIKGTQMLRKTKILDKYSDKAFYNTLYWDHLASVTLQNSVNIHPDATAAWDITDTTVPENEEGAVMAWVVPNWENSSRYDLYIGGRGGLTAPVDCSFLFNGCSASKMNGMTTLNTSKTTTMTAMFESCKAEELDLTGWDISHVTSIDSMFNHCSYLRTLTGVNRWDTSSVTNPAGLFSYCGQLTTLDIGGWDTSKMRNFKELFRGCKKLRPIDLSEWKTSEVRDTSYMFYECENMKTGDQTPLNLSKWDTSNITDANHMFSRCGDMYLNLSGWDVSSLKDLSYMFYDYGLNIQTLDLSSWKNTGNFQNLECMFSSNNWMTTINLNNWNTPNVTNVRSMFSGCGRKDSYTDRVSGLENLDLSGWTIGSKVTNTCAMFSGCYALKTITFPTGWNTAQVTDMTSMFTDCKSLTSLNLNGWNMGNVKALDNMFLRCSALTSIGTTRLDVAAGASARNLQTGANNLGAVSVYAGGTQIDTSSGTRSAALQSADLSQDGEETPESGLQPPPPEADALTSSLEIEAPSNEVQTGAGPEKQASQETNPEESPFLPEEDTLSASLLHASSSTVRPDALDIFGRPLYANKKAGLWDCGQVTAGQTISYALELQYLDENLGKGGASGQLTVTNPIPEGLVYNGDARISTVRRIVSGDSGRTGGTVLQDPEVHDGVLTFTINGLSAGAKYVVTYSCTVPSPGPDGYTEFLNTASVVDNGLADEADPVLHYMNERTVDRCAVTYRYDNPPIGAVLPRAQTCDRGTEITLPTPDTVDGYSFDGWKENGTGSAMPGETAYTVSGNVLFVGTWTRTAEDPKSVHLDYSFDETVPQPENADLILEGLLDGVLLDLPENTNTSAPRLAALPDGWSFRWRFPDGLDVDINDCFNTGRADDWPNGIISIVGEWTPAEYAVTYEYSGYTLPPDPPALPAESLHPRDSQVPLAPSPANILWEDTYGGDLYLFVFKGWSGVDTDPDGCFTMPAEPVVITGEWDLQFVAAPEVLVRPNGGTWKESDEDQVLTQTEYQAMKDGNSFPDPVWEGVQFQRWEETDDPDGQFSKLVTAIWKTYTVTFDIQGHGTTPDPITNLESGAKITAPTPPPAAPGYTFGGWFKEADCTNAWSFDEDTVTDNITLYAKWTEVDKFTVTFDVQGHGTAPASITGLESGTKITAPTPPPSAPGYTFGGWFKEADCTNAWSFDEDTVTDNITLYAKWTEVDKFTVTFDVQGHGTAPASITGLKSGTKITAPTPPPSAPGYAFGGWFKEPACTSAWDFDTDTVTGNITLYAKWTAETEKFTVTFDVQGIGTAPSPITGLLSGAKISAPDPAPSAPGYAFGGWFKEAACSNPWSFGTDTVIKNTTLYAKWTRVYQISGTVKDSEGHPIANAKVKIVHEGDQTFWEDTTGPDGKYTITGVPSGIYNTVATYKNAGTDVTTTILSIIRDEDLLNHNIQFATGNTNSVLTVEQMPEDTPYVVVGGLEQEAETVRKDSAGATAVKVEMKVTPADETAKKTEIQAIEKAAEQAAAKLPSANPLQSHVDLVLDIDLTKALTVAGNNSTEKITSAATVLELVIPYPMEGKDNIQVHRFHSADGEGAVTFTEDTAGGSSRRDKTFYLDKTANLIHVFARKFSSLYAVSYTTEDTGTPPVNPPRPSGGGGSGTSGTTYLITASAGAGGTIRPAGQVRVAAGASRTFTVAPQAGYDVADVLVDGASVGAVTTYTFQNVRANHTIEASFTASGPAGLLNSEDHMDYLHGFRDGLFRPDASMTRGQAAQMFYNLLRDRDIDGQSAFTDVPRDMWCYEAVSALKTLGVMRGVTETRFEPNRPITRAELVVTAVRFTEHEPGTAAFTDVAETDWFYPEVSAAASRGWIGGYEDGTFRPNNPITRAQASAVINRLLGRQADEDFLDSRPDGLRSFPDALPSYWAYGDIMESANGHDYRVQRDGEHWTALHRT